MTRARVRDWRVAVVVVVMTGSFVGAVALPDTVPYALIWAAVIAAATFAPPRTAAALSWYGLVLSIAGGVVSDNAGLQIFWIRMVAYAAIGAVAVLLSIQRSRREATLLDRATTDEVTGLATRRLLVERLEAQMEIRNLDLISAVLYTDLDSFKEVNDSYGHAAGDEVLRRASERLTACTRPADTLARFGGDEFVIACPSLKDEAEVAALCSRILDPFSPTFHAGQVEVTVGITIGAAISSAGSTAGAGALIDAADLALTECKAGSPGTYKIVQA